MHKTTLPKTLNKFIFHFIKKQKWLFVILVVSHLAWAVDQTVMPYIFKVFLDILIGFTGDKSSIWSEVGLIVGIGAALWLFVHAAFRCYDYYSAKTYPSFEANIRMGMMDYVQNHSINYFSGNFAGSIAGKIGDMAKSASMLMQTIIYCFIPTAVAMLIGTLIFINLHPFFALILLIWVALHLGISLFYAKECDSLSNIHSRSANKLNGVIVDSLSNIITMKLFVRKNFELKYLGKFQGEEKQKHEDISYLLFRIRFWQGSLCFLIMGAINTYLMVNKWQSGDITASEVVYIFYTSWGLTVMSWVASTEIPIFFRNIGVCKQALELVQLEHGVKDKVGAGEIKISKGEIKFKNVHFDYQDGARVFLNKNITIKSHQKVGLVGISGSGKTTFVNLINRFFDLNSGEISIDGQDISLVTRDSLRSQIANIVQEPVLFHRSIFDNISYGKENASLEEVINAAKKANCHDFIVKLKDGYNTFVGQRGSKLSGGQRQRIAIARAILKDSPILILDEATSALDSITEQYIQESLDVLMEKRTCIVIAHRLSTLNSMDRILVFDEGKIIEDGSHEELIAKNGHYCKLWNLQK